MAGQANYTRAMVTVAHREGNVKQRRGNCVDRGASWRQRAARILRGVSRTFGVTAPAAVLCVAGGGIVGEGAVREVCLGGVCDLGFP